MFKENNKNQLNQRAIILPILISALLIIFKSFGFYQTNSVSILASLLDSAMDVVISLINIIAVIYATKPADDDHRFGHNSIEDIVGLIQATFIATSALFIVYKAVSSFSGSKHIDNNIDGILVMLVSTACLFFVIIYQKIIIKKTNSTILKSDSLHYTSDILTNVTIIISLILTTNPKLRIIDPILALIIANYIIFSAYKIGIGCFNNLMDKELEQDQKTKIEETINSHPGVMGYHKLKTRRSGNRIFVQAHIDIDKNLTFDQAHQITDNLERTLAKLHEESEIIIHSDPA